MAAAVLLLAASACGERLAVAAAPAVADEPARARTVRLWAVAGVDSLLAAVGRLEHAAAALESTPAAEAAVRAAFVDARLAYKRIEYLVEAYTPTAAEQINGPALPEVDDEEGDRPERPPEGFQVVEEMLHPRPDASRAAELAREAVVLRGTVARVRQLFAANAWDDGVVFDAARQELSRVATLGVAGFDSPVAGWSAPEAAAALRGVRAGLAAYAPPVGHPRTGDAAIQWRRTDSTLAAAAAYLDSNPDFERLDRLAFITRHVVPSARGVVALREAFGIAPAGGLSLWRGDAATVFDADAFDPGALASPFVQAATSAGARTARVALGRELFVEPALSRAGRTCASCHDPSRAFTDGRARSAAVDARHGATLRNAPTLLNAALQGAQFADLRATYLEDQVVDVVRNRDEMGGSLPDAAAALRNRPVFRAAFAAAFGGTADSMAVTERRVAAALAAYVRSLTALNAPFDRYVRGDTSAMTPAARRGFNTFMGKAKCGTCHFAPLFNGTVPPAFVKTEVEVIGVPATTSTSRPQLDPDPGRMRITAAALHRHAFKTPTVRNAAVTPPYMHNGAFRTLEEVVDFYDRGGGVGMGLRVPNQTLPGDSLHLTTREKRDLIAFMHALTDTMPR
jgi:cytochrome c peroxidase